jgi:hypothetical protein
MWSHEEPETVEDQELGFGQFVIQEAKRLTLRKDAVSKAVVRYGKKWRERAKHPE